MIVEYSICTCNAQKLLLKEFIDDYHCKGAEEYCHVKQDVRVTNGVCFGKKEGMAT